MTVVHYYDEDYPTDSEHAPLCKKGLPGDEMTMFVDLTRCGGCETILFGEVPESVAVAIVHPQPASDENARPTSAS